MKMNYLLRLLGNYTMKKISSRERMLTAIECSKSDYVPMSFMIFSALRHRCKDQYDFVDKQLELGLDAFVDLMSPVDTQSEHSDLHGLPVRFDPRVQIKEWREDNANESFPLLHKEYITPSGTLKTVVNKTEDWQHGDHVPLFDDYLIPRSKKFLVTEKNDLKPLRHLLMPLSENDIRIFRESAKRAKEFADSRELLVTGGWGVGMDLACWIGGIENLMLSSIYDPEFVDELANIIAEWNQGRMKVVLDVGVDLYIRRGWYESTDFWAPDMFRQLILPSLKKEADMAHQANAKFGYILTTSMTPILDQLLESGIDVLIGIDPVQGRGTDMAEIKRRIGDKICLWGGVNGFVTVEMGTKEEIANAVQTAINAMSLNGGFILSPVDNIRDTSDETWEKVEFMIDMWKKLK
jgi:uroporphyrinogen decarboxylase